MGREVSGVHDRRSECLIEKHLHYYRTPSALDPRGDELRVGKTEDGGTEQSSRRHLALQ